MPNFPSPRPGEQLLLLPELARWLKVPAGTVRRWAHEDNWRRVSMRGRTYYSAEEAGASKQRRRGDTPTGTLDAPPNERHAAHGSRTAPADGDFGYSALAAAVGLIPRQPRATDPSGRHQPRPGTPTPDTRA